MGAAHIDTSGQHSEHTGSVEYRDHMHNDHDSSSSSEMHRDAISRTLLNAALKESESERSHHSASFSQSLSGSFVHSGGVVSTSRHEFYHQSELSTSAASIDDAADTVNQAVDNISSKVSA